MVCGRGILLHLRLIAYKVGHHSETRRKFFLAIVNAVNRMFVIYINHRASIIFARSLNGRSLSMYKILLFILSPWYKKNCVIMTVIEIVDPRNHHRVAQREIPGQSCGFCMPVIFSHPLLPYSRRVSVARSEWLTEIENCLDEGRRFYLRVCWIYLANCLVLCTAPRIDVTCFLTQIYITRQKFMSPYTHAPTLIAFVLVFFIVIQYLSYMLIQ